MDRQADKIAMAKTR